MAGHSKWANIKHRKGRQDAKRSKLWSKCSRAIIVAAKNGGGDPDTNLTLRYAIDEAKSQNMPKDTIENAIKKGTGQDEAVSYETVIYEGYGPAGVAVLAEAMTDNRNRTAPEVRKLFEKHGGNLGATGCVWLLRGELYSVLARPAPPRCKGANGIGGDAGGSFRCSDASRAHGRRPIRFTRQPGAWAGAERRGTDNACAGVGGWRS